MQDKATVRRDQCLSSERARINGTASKTPMSHLPQSESRLESGPGHTSGFGSARKLEYVEKIGHHKHNESRVNQ